MKHHSIFVLLLSALSTLAHSAQTLDQAVAIVDDDVVLKSELDRRVDTVRSDLAQRNIRPPTEDVLRQQVLDRLIVDNLQLQLARRAGVRISDQELAAIIENIAKENKMTVEQFRLKLTADGVNYELFREDIRNEVMVSRARQGHVSRRVYISQSEVEALADLIQREGENNSEYHLGHILISISESASTSDVAVAQERARLIVERIRNGADFSEMALANSEGQEALQGGDFGWKTLNQMPTLFATSVRNMKVAEVSDPIRSATGLHILKLFDIKGIERVVVQQTHARHILIQPSKILTEIDAEKKARELLTQIREGADFAKLAKEHSADPGSGSQGGDLGWANPGTFVPVFENTMSKLNPGEISEPVRSEFGWHIIEVLGRRADDQTEDKIKDRAYRILHGRKFEEEVETWIREIRDQAYVKVLETKS